MVLLSLTYIRKSEQLSLIFNLKNNYCLHLKLDNIPERSSIHLSL